MNLEEAVKTAIEYETKVKDVYGEAIASTKDPVGKRVLEVLAKEEQGHLDYLNAKLKQLKDSGTAEPEFLETVVPSRDTIAAGVKKLQKKMDAEDHANDIQLLEKALDVEKETSEFYKRMVSELDAKGQKFFERFVEIEEGHYAIVQAEIDALNGMGFWFDFMEFDLEAG